MFRNRSYGQPGLVLSNLHPGFRYAKKKMNAIIADAYLILDKFPEGEPKKYMKKLVEYTIQRKY